MCYHFSDSQAEPTSLEYTTTLTAGNGDTTPLAVKAEPSREGYRVVLTPEADAENPKTFEVGAARDHDDVQGFVADLVASFARPYDPADPFDRLAYHAGLGSSSLANTCERWQARDLTDYSAA